MLYPTLNPKLSILVITLVVGFLGSGRTLEGSLRTSGQMHLFSSGSGYVLTGNRFLWTDDWGGNWSDNTPPITEDKSIGGIFFLNSSQGWIETHSNTLPAQISVSSTIDGGKHWATVPFLALNHDLRIGYAGESEISFSDPLHGWFLMRQMSGAAHSVGALFTTSDGAQTWSQCPFPPVAGPILFTSQQVGWLAGGVRNQYLYRTEDAGQSWTQQTVPAPKRFENATEVNFKLPYFGDSNQALLSVRFQNSDHTSMVAIYTSSDSGQSWRLSRRYVGTRFVAPIVAAAAESPKVMTLSVQHNQMHIWDVDGSDHVITLPYPPTVRSGLLEMEFGDRLHWWIHMAGDRYQGPGRGYASFTAWIKTDDRGATFTPLFPR